jgi:hypothetical protein
MSTRFYYGQQDYIVQLNLMDDIASGSASTVAFDNFDARYLGTKTADPTLNNKGAALTEGAMYWNSVSKLLKVYNGTTWGAIGTATAASVGLGNVDNTSDINKPVSTATQTALNLKANLASPTFTGTVTAPTFSGALSGNATTATTASAAPWSGITGKPTTLAGYGITDGGTPATFAWSGITGTPTTLAGYGITDGGTPATYPWANISGKPTTLAGYGIPAVTKADVGLGSVDNTADAAKPVSTAQQTALNLKANLASPTFTGTVTAPTFSGVLTGNATTATTATNATNASAVPWSGISSKPTTVASYGITDISSYAPTLTGAGASGSWAINVTGSAAMAAEVYCADGDRNAATKLPTLSKRVRYDFVNASTTGTGGSFAGVMTFAPWDGTTASTGSCSYQLVFGSTGQNGGTPHLRVRNGIDSTWNSWYDVWHAGNLAAPSVAAAINTLVQRDNNGYIFGSYLNQTDDGTNGPNNGGAVTGIITKRGDNYYRTTGAVAVKTFLGITGADVYSVRSNADSYVGVAREMAWRSYGNSHTIFDASSGLTPTGIACNNTNADNDWSATYPSLMGYNGSATYGVRVARAWRAEGLTDPLLNRIQTNAINRGSYGSISISGLTNSYCGIDFTPVNMTFMSNGGTFGVYVNNTAWAWNSDYAGNFTAFGNVTAYSDERLKTNWRDVQSDFVALWANVKHGTYDRLDVVATQVGLSAQDVQAILPHAVSEGAPTIDGQVFLTLNYGAAAAVATVELAKKATEQAALIEMLIKRIEVLEAK